MALKTNDKRHENEHWLWIYRLMEVLRSKIKTEKEWDRYVEQARPEDDENYAARQRRSQKS
jgi:hypothetical protein